MNKMHNYEPYAIEEGYQVLIAEYHHALCGIEDYFKQADRKLVLKLVDDTSCKLLRMTTPREDKEKCPDPRVSTENLMTGPRAQNRLAALPNFTDIEGADREEVCDLFDSLQTAHVTIADAAGTLASWVKDYIHTNSSFCSNTPYAPHPVTNTGSPLPPW